MGNATINVNAELAAQGFTGPFTGSASFKYTNRYSGALIAETYVENAKESLSFTVPSTEKPTKSPKQNAVFWLLSSDAEVYIALQNVSDVAIHVAPTVSINGQDIHLRSAQLQPHDSSVIEISNDSNIGPLKSAWRAGLAGGITVAQDGPPGALNTGGWIEDDERGYATTMTFQAPTSGTGELIGTQILVGDIGELLDLARPFAISSRLVVRNVSDKPVDFEGQLAFSTEHTVLKAPIASTHLDVGEVRLIDLDGVKKDANIPTSFVSASIEIHNSGAASALMARVYGVADETSYGFYWALQPSAGGTYNESFWTTSENWIPIITTGNFKDVDDTVTVELTSNSGTFTLPPISLHSMESYTINVRSLLDAGTKDRNGNAFPKDVHFGGYRIYGSSKQSKIVVKEHLIDTSRKLSTPFYGDYPYSVALYFVPVEDPPEGPSQDVYYGVDPSDGSTVGATTFMDYSDGSTINGCPFSANGNPYYIDNGSNIVSVAREGCNGIITGLQDGSATISASQDNVTVDDSGDQTTLYTSNSGQITSKTAPPGCPTDINLASTTAVPLENSSSNPNRQFPALRTGVGGITQMVVNDPLGQNWNGAKITEEITSGANSCDPNSFGACRASSAPFVIGLGGGSAFGVPVPPTTNAVWDLNASTASFDALTRAGQTSCTQVCYQFFVCRGTSFSNSFKITFNYTKDTIQGTSVTRVTLTKELQ